ncbi:biotin--[acetyl-CoA-carboxylase] synthetase [Plasmodium gonderi]|uniref:Biotin--[acetyl-CoA-carboxylase] synthetase n=1 Tax=Plasmodium gonderi TaxID=77519 RepID=A0A1Y1JBS4_PLAGO|nr:biotin--[acetyl-CoA-carboxylase] synthetase [Plasmodium gonderi]GAW79969.1 biotin--[acetyl-CoA-carboxylase] synthetase [Plasmodium gonderi]
MKEPNVVFKKRYSELKVLRLHFDVLDSTQLYCRRNMKQFMQNGDLRDDKNMIVVSCNDQTNGIGTRDTKKNEDRVWVSERGNVFTTCVILWKREDLDKVKYLAQTSTVAVSKTLEYFHLITQIKWINDVLVNQKKISGCLINLYHLDDCPSLLRSYVCIMIGTGINLHLKDEGNILKNNYTSVEKELERDFQNPALVPSVEEVTEKFIENLHSALGKLRTDGFSYFLDYITPRLLYKDKKVIIDMDNQVIDGQLKGLRNDGSIILLREENEIVNINIGHLRLFDE